MGGFVGSEDKAAAGQAHRCNCRERNKGMEEQHAGLKIRSPTCHETQQSETGNEHHVGLSFRDRRQQERVS